MKIQFFCSKNIAELVCGGRVCLFCWMIDTDIQSNYTIFLCNSVCSSRGREYEWPIKISSVSYFTFVFFMCGTYQLNYAWGASFLNTQSSYWQKSNWNFTQLLDSGIMLHLLIFISVTRNSSSLYLLAYEKITVFSSFLIVHKR